MNLRHLCRFALRGPVLAVAITVALTSCGSGGGGERAAAGDPVGQGAIARLIRLDDDQYKQAMIDVFGPTLVLNSALAESEKRSAGLLAVGDAEVSYTSAGFESAENMAQLVADQAVDPAHRDVFIPCQPADAKQPDDACAGEFFASVGRLLFRRALSSAELQGLVGIAHASATTTADFYNGLSFGLARMLVSPNFLFRVEKAVPDGEGKYRLTAYSMAGRLSALLWNSNPDDELLAAAERGELNSSAEVRRQVERMLASPKLENGVRAFFSDMLEFDKFETLAKDPAIYPQFTPNLTHEAREQALRVIVHELLAKHGDYRQLFLTRETFLTPSLAALSGIELSAGVNNGEPDRWIPYQYADGDPRAGFLALPAFTALNSHPGRSSPTLRGKALRQNLLCQVVPDPPAGVDFELFNSGEAGHTARERLTAHNSVPSCAGCHKIMDPIGLGLERFDGSGRLRDTENGYAIDTSGNLDGVAYKDARQLAKVVSEAKSTELCLVNRVTSYGLARPLTASDRSFVESLSKQFSKEGRQLPELLRSIATAEEFCLLDPPKAPAVKGGAAAPVQTLNSQAAVGADQ
jgi:hypothetical protein